MADFDDELDRTLCGYSIEKKQKIWDCIKLDYPALIAWEQCMSYLGVHTGGEFLNNNCGPSDVPLEYRESFSKCIESRIKSENVKQKSEEEERDMFRQCIEELD